MFKKENIWIDILAICPLLLAPLYIFIPSAIVYFIVANIITCASVIDYLINKPKIPIWSIIIIPIYVFMRDKAFGKKQIRFVMYCMSFIAFVFVIMMFK